MNDRKTPRFVRGLKLSELFYRKAVRPILASNFPTVQYSAGLLGSGSETLGFDTIRSTDHHWGPRLQLFLSDDDYGTYSKRIDKALAKALPRQFLGYSTNFGPPDRIGVRLMTNIESGPVSHAVEITTIPSFLENYLGIRLDLKMRILDWLTIPEQRLLSVSQGSVFHDGRGELSQVLRKFSYYPQDVWLLLLAAQ